MMRKKTIRKSQKNKRKTIRKYGGNTDSPKRFKCCVCKKTVGKDRVFETTRCKVDAIPDDRRSLGIGMNAEEPKVRKSLKGPYYRHKICSDCWWGTEDAPGFANEESVHECPGCKQNIPPIRKPVREPKFIDLTEED